ncbi:MAG: 3-deoxy-manno-octulosonate cytidylyltransferase [Phycisphaerales bacterium]|nr:3-deoxy-manno-octulosonate cytidylyltransferase [Phycisphaerales bacterium]
MGRIVAVIPARLNSSRFPGKMLACETGKPLIQHAWERARACTAIHETIIATDHAAIRDAALAFGARCVMTRCDHQNGTSRICEAIATVDASIIVNVQGDEPEIEPELISAAIAALVGDEGAALATVVSPFLPEEDPSNPNIVKCVVGLNNRALYFSRALIPFCRAGGAPANPLKHVGLYVYRRAFLNAFPSLAATPLEQAEQLEQLRALEHGFPIAVARGIARSQGIDTPEQYAAFVRRFRES